MKSTFKVVLVISLFCSTALFTYADGDQTAGGRNCQSNCFGIESVEIQPIENQQITETTNNQLKPVAQNNKNNKVSEDEEDILFLIREFFKQLFG